MSEKLFVTIASSQRTVDVQLPDDVRIEDLLPLLVEVCGLSRKLRHAVGGETVIWSLRTSSVVEPFIGSHTLADEGVLDGEVLLLEQSNLSTHTLLMKTKSLPRLGDITPTEQTGWIGVTWDKS